MSRFLTSLNVRLMQSDHDNGNSTWMVMSPLLYESDVANRIINVPVAFETDFASVPRVPVVFDLMGDLAHGAAVLHDYLYTTGEVSRATADAVLKEAAIVSGVPPWKAWLMYVAVRAFGASHYLPK